MLSLQDGDLTSLLQLQMSLGLEFGLRVTSTLELRLAL